MNKGRKEICRRFNEGKCTAGLSCKYDHRCLECGKFGHGEHICRKKLNQNKSSNNECGNGGQGVGNSYAGVSASATMQNR